MYTGEELTETESEQYVPDDCQMPSSKPKNPKKRKKQRYGVKADATVFYQEDQTGKKTECQRDHSKILKPSRIWKDKN